MSRVGGTSLLNSTLLKLPLLYSSRNFSGKSDYLTRGLVREKWFVFALISITMSETVGMFTDM